jgi:hypothetical protein
MFKKQTFELAVASSLFVALTAAGCGQMDSTVDDPTATSAPGKGLPGNVEVTRSALTNTDRGEVRAVAAGDHLFLTWIDNHNGVDQVWGWAVDDRTGMGWNGATPQVLVGAAPIDWAEIVYDSVHDQIILAVNYVYSAVDHDVYMITLDHSGNPVTSLLVVDNSTNDDYGSWVAYDPTAQTAVFSWVREVPGTNHKIMASYMPPYSVPGPAFNFNPAGISSSLGFGGVTYARSSTQSRFVTTSEDGTSGYVSTVPANQTWMSTSRGFGRFARLYTSFMASSFTVGMTGYDSTNGLSFIPFNTNSCFPNWLCSLPATHIVDAVPGHTIAYAIGAVDGNFIVAADPGGDNHLKVMALSPSGGIVKMRTYAASSTVREVGSIVRGPNFNWIFWLDYNHQIIGQKIDDLGNGGGEYVIVSSS